MKTLLLTIVVMLHNQPREEYKVEAHSPGFVTHSTADVGFYGYKAQDHACQVWAEQVLKGLQYGPFNGGALLPGESSSIHYRIERSANEI